MSKRAERAATARQTLTIMADGGYEGPAGWCDLAADLADAVDATGWYHPSDLSALLRRADTAIASRPARRHQIAVTDETTLAAARRLTQQGHDVIALNFASARNPGGGWLGGSQAQEESLARASGLVACIEPQADVYDAQRADGRGGLYQDYLIHSRGVPVFRDDDDRLLDAPYRVSFVTAAAPNARAVQRNDPSLVEQIPEAFRRRIDAVLAIAVEHGHDAMVLGAWGCGVFGNDPDDVAHWMAQAIDGRFRGAFDAVVFAIVDFGRGRTRAAFEAAFAAG